jgi:hypothetical protein
MPCATSNARVSCVSARFGARGTVPESVSRTFAVHGRRQSNPSSNLQEVYRDVDAVRSIPRV